MSDPGASDAIAVEGIARWQRAPQLMVRELFAVTPDAWQDDALALFPRTPRLALKACKGPGKTAVLAWLGWNFMLTRPHARAGATSISGDNLKSNLWTELAVWYERSPLLRSVFEMTKSEIFHRGHPRTWKLEARTWAKDATQEQLGQALAGLHGRYVMWLLDESGGYPLAILPIAEAIFGGDPVEAHVVQAGNTVSREGPLYHACVPARHLWQVVGITGDPDDPQRSPRIPIEYAREQIAQYGRDNPWVKISIFGEFPSSGLNTLIGEEEVAAATRRSYHPDDVAAAPRILGVDVARFGDDASVMWPRQGLVAFAPARWRNIDGIQGGGAVARKWGDWDADACFVDNSGGYGSSWIDNLRLLGRAPIPVDFSGKAHDVRYYNKRAEMYFSGAQWIKDGGQLPPPTAPGMRELTGALTQTTYAFKGDRLLLEPKDLVKARLGYSPDDADAFCLTFADPVAPRMARRGARGGIQADYDPFAHVMGGGSKLQSNYDPFGG